MVKKFIGFILCIVMAVGSCLGLTSCSKNESFTQIETTPQEVIDELVDIALDEVDYRIDDYIDVSYFVNLSKDNESSNNNSVKKLSVSLVTDDEELIVDAEQYYELTSSINNIFSELTDEEYDAIKTMAEQDEDIAEMLEMIESDFENYDYTVDNDTTISATGIMLTSTAVATIGSILLSQGVNSAAVVAIKGAFNTMIATLKAFFLTNTVKAVIITAAILVIATVVIVNWNKIKPVFNKIVNIFVDNAKKLAATVTKVFNSIFNKAISSSISAALDAAITSDIIKIMGQYGLTEKLIKSLVKEFTNINMDEDTNIRLYTWVQLMINMMKLQVKIKTALLFMFQMTNGIVM